MDEEIKIQLSKLLEPESILPNLRLSRPRETFQHDVLPVNTNESDASAETDEDYPPEETVEDYPPEETVEDYPPEKTDENYPPKESDEDYPPGETDENNPPKESDEDYSPEETDEDYPADETDEDYLPEENSTKPPPKKKRKPVNFNNLSENSSKPSGITSRELHLLIKGDTVIEFCQEQGLIATEVMCSCGKPMRLTSKSGNDGCRWMCYVKSHTARPNQTIRKGTWFESSKLSLGDILWLAYMWVYEYSIISMMHECDHSNSTVMGWCTFCIEFCREIVEYKSHPIGGEASTVEIFYCAIKEKKRSTGPWAFCAIELYSTNSLYLIVNDNNSASLLQVFEKYVLPGTKVVANNWSFLKTLNVEDFSYLTQKRSISFIDLVTNRKIDTFEMFQKTANRPSKLDEWSKLEYGPTFFEKVYRKCLKNSPDAFLTFLKDVATIYKPCDKFNSSTNSIQTIR